MKFVSIVIAADVIVTIVSVCSDACSRHTAAESDTKERWRLHIF